MMTHMMMITNVSANWLRRAVNWKNIPSAMCAQWRLKPSCTSAHTGKSLCGPHQETLHPKRSKMCPVKILIGLRECAVWSESSLGAHVRRYVSGRFGSKIASVSVKLNNPLLCFLHLLESRSLYTEEVNLQIFVISCKTICRIYQCTVSFFFYSLVFKIKYIFIFL